MHNRSERDASSMLTLDHAIPWSAGGSDYGDNLRTLWLHCNETRSNYVDVAPSRPRYVTIVGTTPDTSGAILL